MAVEPVADSLDLVRPAMLVRGIWDDLRGVALPMAVEVATTGIDVRRDPARLLLPLLAMEALLMSTSFSQRVDGKVVLLLLLPPPPLVSC